MTNAPCIFPTFRFRDAPAMIEWLEQAFGFTIHEKYQEGETVMHAELALGRSIIMCGSMKPDEFGEMVGEPAPGGKSLYIAFEDVDGVHERALKAGARMLQGLTERDYGSREFICADPEGNIWCFGTYWPKAT